MIITVASDASGSARAAGLGQVVVIVDVIDMSTTMEAMLDEGALAVFGAAPDAARAPVPLNPAGIGLEAGRLACASDTGVVVVAEPRVGSDADRISGIQKVLRGIRESGAAVESVLPNLGAETVKLAGIKGRVVVAATSSGGVAFDAAVAAGAPAVLTGTIARTARKKGIFPAAAAADRVLKAALEFKADIAVIASSGNSMEDVLAAGYIYNLLLGMTRDII
ncbi:MAG: hypothetical protein WC364_09895 [Eubacteriales bacterium]|jgi:hypothetical protein